MGPIQFPEAIDHNELTPQTTVLLSVGGIIAAPTECSPPTNRERDIKSWDYERKRPDTCSKWGVGLLYSQQYPKMTERQRGRSLRYRRYTSRKEESNKS